jgi:DNA repair protein RadC
LRGRFRDAGADALSDYELLELLLFRALPPRDVKPLAKTLLAKFGSFAEVIAAPEARLAEVKGLGGAGITELKIVQAAASRLLRGVLKKRPVLSSWSNVLDYCRSAQGIADCEQFRVLFLDNRRSTANRHRRSHAGLSARSRQARARIICECDYPGAQSSVGRSDALAGRHPDDEGDHRGGGPARHCGSRSPHRRQRGACEPQGAQVDLRPPEV